MDMKTEASEVPSTSVAESGELVCAPVRVIESLDKVIESLEKIMEPLEIMTESDLNPQSSRSQADWGKLQLSFEDLRLLAEQLAELGLKTEIGSSDQYLCLTVNERNALQCRVVRQALSLYQEQLTADDTHYQLKCCLAAEVTRLSDLLDTATDPDKLATLVRQMRELLKHQAELSSQLQEWGGESTGEGEPCHQLCESVMRRLRTLELVVQRNTRTLSHLQSQMHPT